MAAKFIALPVGQGDAFFVRTDDRSILIDGGRSVQSFPQMFKDRTRRKGVDILVCTHNDADHANGVLGFLREGLGCDELWLPISWIEAIKSLPEDPMECIRALDNFVEKFASREGPIEAYRTRLPEHEEERVSEQEQVPQRLDALLGEHLDRLMPGYEWILEESYQLPWLGLWPRCKYSTLKLGDVLFPFWQNMQRILQIATEALNRGIKVRCYRHTSSVSSIPPKSSLPLIPLNCVPTATLRPVNSIEVVTMLALTTDNRESLCFWLEPNDNHPGVLFTSDTDLDGKTLPKQMLGAIVTAPHHGSADNKKVYGAVQDEVVWVRSDMFSRKRPCCEYLKAKGTRFCTLCRGAAAHRKQAVCLDGTRGRWKPNHATRVCECS